ncbi:hypothetical protein EJ06DRAFT_546956 [Trichodelitschia bisporula]|uniref:Uncharacterized protein n=1 Tax=Trichodelitschia bisporula TaxID=703511 RepID=A0A6G1I722_9PEZI|nr:hypothetical protein EJ06DRAFT_546956 [Trichodelitschia bisporula]
MAIIGAHRAARVSLSVSTSGANLMAATAPSARRSNFQASQKLNDARMRVSAPAQARSCGRAAADNGSSSVPHRKQDELLQLVKLDACMLATCPTTITTVKWTMRRQRAGSMKAMWCAGSYGKAGSGNGSDTSNLLHLLQSEAGKAGHRRGNGRRGEPFGPPSNGPASDNGAHGMSRADSGSEGSASSEEVRSTRPERYDPKPPKKKRDKKAESKGRKTSKTEKKDRKKADSHSFRAKNVPCDRLTLKPQAGFGLFNRGKASSPFRGRGLPDLAFNEISFLQKRDVPEEPPAESRNARRKKERARANEEEISTYFVPKRDVPAVKDSNHPPGPHKVSNQSTRERYRQDSTHDAESHVSIRPTIEHPEERRMRSDPRTSRAASTSCFSWTESSARLQRSSLRPRPATDGAVKLKDVWYLMKTAADHYSKAPLRPQIASQKHVERPTTRPRSSCVSKEPPSPDQARKENPLQSVSNQDQRGLSPRRSTPRILEELEENSVCSPRMPEVRGQPGGTNGNLPGLSRERVWVPDSRQRPANVRVERNVPDARAHSPSMNGRRQHCNARSLQNPEQGSYTNNWATPGRARHAEPVTRPLLYPELFRDEFPVPENVETYHRTNARSPVPLGGMNEGIIDHLLYCSPSDEIAVEDAEVANQPMDAQFDTQDDFGRSAILEDEMPYHEEVPYHNTEVDNFNQAQRSLVTLYDGEKISASGFWRPRRLY